MQSQLVNAAIVASTEYNYRTLIRNWFRFCDRCNVNTIDSSDQVIYDYICFLFEDLDKTEGTATKSLTALSHWFAINRIKWTREGNPIITKMLKGFAHLKPSRKYPKKPITIEIVRRFVQWADLETYTGTLHWVMVLTAYWFALRSGEYSYGSKHTSHHVLKGKDLVFTWNAGRTDIVQATLNVHGHKGDPMAQRDAHVPVRCLCTVDGKPRDHVHCPVHALLKYSAQRAACGFTDDDALFICCYKRQRLLSSHVNQIIRGWLYAVGLNGNEYTAHCLRSGRATDLARAKTPAYVIKKFCRWISDCWESYYLKLDFSDLARITAVSLQDLNLSLTNEISPMSVVASAAAANPPAQRALCAECDHCRTAKAELQRMVDAAVAARFDRVQSTNLSFHPMVAAPPRQQVCSPIMQPLPPPMSPRQSNHSNATPPNRFFDDSASSSSAVSAGRSPFTVQQHHNAIAMQPAVTRRRLTISDRGITSMTSQPRARNVRTDSPTTQRTPNRTNSANNRRSAQSSAAGRAIGLSLPSLDFQPTNSAPPLRTALTDPRPITSRPMLVTTMSATTTRRRRTQRYHGDWIDQDDQEEDDQDYVPTPTQKVAARRERRRH